MAYYPATGGAPGDDDNVVPVARSARERDALLWARQPAPGSRPAREHEERHRWPRRRDAWPVRLLRWASGLVAGGLVALALAVGLVATFSDDWSIAGPGPASIAWHAIGAVIAVGAQVAADRSRGPIAASWSVLVLTAGALLLLTQWWS
ncbi:hypothetical protein [Lolliginicoccus suaedae]|uniref:hypothetical protein n=1 Tax=Lolliginicoccus suaedae TaxID=2605429 RepID=UPI0011ECBDF0|nr:hypothetical protein [Lolliginicoccus suaedae]